MSKTVREVVVETFGKLVSESNINEPLRATGPDWILSALDDAGFVIVPRDFLIKLTERLSGSGQMPNNSYMEGRNATLAEVNREIIKLLMDSAKDSQS